MPPFVHLRTRSAYSLLEGAMPVKAIKALCLELGQPACALTDTNNLFGALEFSEELAQAGVQPIIGLTLSVRTSTARPGDTRQEPDGSLVLLAQSRAGYARLMALSSSAYLDVDAVEPPHVGLDAILRDTEGLLALTGGPSGLVDRALLQGRDDQARALLDRLIQAFPDRLYIELQRHDLPEERKVEPFLVDVAYGRGLPLAATNEPYFARPAQHAAHDALLCLNEGSFLSVAERRRVTALHHFADGADMAARFADLPEAIATTLEVARRCAYRPTTHAPILPRFTTQEGRDEGAELTAQAQAGLAARLKAITPAAERSVYEARLAHELSVIIQMGFSGYFLIVSDFIKWAKGEGIPVGPGRGSGAGSLVAYALTITDLDPLRFGLLFERFLNPERVSMPDFDIDFCQERRGEVIDYVTRRYGSDRVAQIITFGSLQARAVLRDVGRVMQLPFGMVDRLAKMVPSNPANPVKLAEAIEGEPRLQAARKDDADVAKLLGTALELEGLYRNASTHAAGVVIGDRPLVELVPLYRDPRADLPATQFNMKWVEPAGLVKFDFLGLKTLTVLDRAIGFLRRDGVKIDLEALPLDDAATYEMLSTGASIGVFQLESSGMRDTLKKLRPDKIEDIIALISLYRPGPMKNIDTYVDRKFGRAKADYLHPTLKPVLEETYGVIIYQEQVMQIAQILSGYSLGEADLLRRAMGKKKPEEMAKQKDRFLAGAKANGVETGRAEKIFDLVAEFAGYGFNKSHAAAYALIAYQTGYLKANYPVAFMAALMSLDLTNTDKLASFVQECRRLGVRVDPPDVNASSADFDVIDGAVRYGLGAVRNVGLAAMGAIVRDRAEKGAFIDLSDFGRRLDSKSINRRALETLSRAGAFDSLGVDRAQALAACEELVSLAAAEAASRAAQQSSLFGEDASALSTPIRAQAEPWTQHQRLDEERVAIGFYLSGHPLDECIEALRRRTVILSAEFEEAVREGRHRGRVAGIVRTRQERVSDRSHDRFAYVALSDPTGEFEAFVPPEVLVRARPLLEPGSAVFCSARLVGRDGEMRVSLDTVEALDGALEGAFGGMRVITRDVQAVGAIRDVLIRLAAREGGDRGLVTLVVPAGEGREVELALPGPWPVDAAARAAVKTTRGVEAVEEV